VSRGLKSHFVRDFLMQNRLCCESNIAVTHPRHACKVVQDAKPYASRWQKKAGRSRSGIRWPTRVRDPRFNPDRQLQIESTTRTRPYTLKKEHRRLLRLLLSRQTDPADSA